MVAERHSPYVPDTQHAPAVDTARASYPLDQDADPVALTQAGNDLRAAVADVHDELAIGEDRAVRPSYRRLTE